MNNKRIIYIGAVIAVVALAGFFLWKSNSSKATSLAQPLTIQGDLSSLTPEQKREIADFRKLILARVKSKTPLTFEEKGVIKVSLITDQKPSPLGFTVIDQSIYQFTAEELQMISGAMSR